MTFGLCFLSSLNSPYSPNFLRSSVLLGGRVIARRNSSVRALQISLVFNNNHSNLIFDQHTTVRNLHHKSRLAVETCLGQVLSVRQLRHHNLSSILIGYTTPYQLQPLLSGATSPINKLRSHTFHYERQNEKTKSRPGCSIRG